VKMHYLVVDSLKHLPATCSNLSCYKTYCREDRAILRTFLATVPVKHPGHH
jgi:hypothetical protein